MNIADAPAWLSERLAGVPCSGCGAAKTKYIGVFERPGVARRVGYTVCERCVRSPRRVARLVEQRVRAIEAITCHGGAA